MKLKTKVQWLNGICWGLVLVLYPLACFLCNKYDALSFLYVFFFVEIALILAPAFYGERRTERVRLPEDYVPSEKPILEIRNRSAWRGVLRDEVLFLLFVLVTALDDFSRHESFDWFLFLFLVIASIPVDIIMFRSIKKSSYTFRSDRLQIKEYRFGKLATDLDIPLEQINDLRYQYATNQSLIMEVNGNKLKLQTCGCAEQIANEILSRQKKQLFL